MCCKIFFSELKRIVTPMNNKELISINNEKSSDVLGRFAESILLNDKVVIPLNGPALEIVTLIRWLGERNFLKLLESEALEFSLCPGILVYISEKVIQHLNFKSEPGLSIVTESNDSWENILDAVRMVLTKQLEYPLGKARRLSRKIEKYTKTLDSKAIYKDAENSGLNYLIQSNDYPYDDKSQLMKFDSVLNKKEIRILLDVVSVHSDLKVASEMDCINLYGNELTWSIIEHYSRKIENQEKIGGQLNTILEIEDIPNIATLIQHGFSSEKIVKMRLDPNSRKFRNWFKNNKDLEQKEIIKEYYHYCFKDSKIDNLPTKILRVGVPIIVGALGPVGNIISSVYSIFDSFWLDKIIKGWNPKTFIDKHFSYSQYLSNK